MGLMEEDCLLLQMAVSLKILKYTSFINKARELVELFKKEKCDFIIALTHMRLYNDKYFAL